MVSQRYGLRVHKFTRNELIKDGWGRKTFDLLNATYKDLYGFSQLSDRQIDKLVNLVTAVMDGDKMVGFGITFPSFSEAMQKTRDGRFLPFGWWHLLKVLKWHKTPLVDLLLIGVLPEYRGKGANALIFDDLIRWFQRYHFEYAITGPQMESNEGVLSQWQYSRGHSLSPPSLLSQVFIKKEASRFGRLLSFMLSQPATGLSRR